MSLKVASFTLHASAAQSARWKQVAEAEGFPSVGAWAAKALDAYLKARARAGLPIPLEWRRGRFPVALEGEETIVQGHLSPPFGAYCGTAAGESYYSGRHRYTLVYIPSRRILATVRTYAQCRALAAELARLWVRGDGSEPAGDPPVLVSMDFGMSKVAILGPVLYSELIDLAVGARDFLWDVSDIERADAEVRMPDKHVLWIIPVQPAIHGKGWRRNGRIAYFSGLYIR